MIFASRKKKVPFSVVIGNVTPPPPRSSKKDIRQRHRDKRYEDRSECGKTLNVHEKRGPAAYLIARAYRPSGITTPRSSG